MRSIIAYIPARGGSKRLPGKNVKRLQGRPVIAHVIRELKKLDFLAGVCVSTDSPRIARVASKAGAAVLELRKASLADDRTDFLTLFVEDVPRYLKAFGIPESRSKVLFVLPTAALVSAAIYRKAQKAFIHSRADILVASQECECSPFRALSNSGRGWRPLFPDKLALGSQHLPPARRDAGLFYFLRYKKMRAVKKHWFNAKRLNLFLVPEAIAVDVNTRQDWEELRRKAGAWNR